ncbi:MAG TPA: ribonuclease Z [Candidatus Alectryocaccobium stercorigallinarum]|nr:ribonuclease Z [Candidatus Alectryocaccobium stercorigallinarum]
MLDICLLGTGGMMPLPHRWLTSLMTRYNGSSLLIDCGEGTQIAIQKQGWSFKQIDTICFTHFHADHISGLPGILLAMANADRTEPVRIIGPKGVERVVGCLRVIAQELPFELVFHELKDGCEKFVENGYNITAFKVRHNTVCYGYSIEIPRAGKFDADRAKAADIPLKYWNPLQKGQTVEDGERIYTPDMVLGPERKGIKVTYTTDTRPVQSITENATGSDIFICEGMYGEQDKEEKAKEHKHMTMQEAAYLAAEAKVKQLWLTHFSPATSNPKWYIKQIRAVFPETVMGEDGMTAELNFDDTCNENGDLK